ncbi:YkgJ family cysteine cluster protein [Thermoactinomyces sp. CICC 10523]|uniref:YkgJ family cysteine cluster protein n=1 Tax=Thermoactinomyces sp. CICC 10523 TaxID=2767428 RepID=UPI0018DC0AF1|nr:YkgJ family cysteine cluster protein [Thermoactinomyces sp. CICC 10523]MBH8598262.1 YkgJ family cysteine cluster protein [Thermoactinomyces sp. CICC 10523]
MENLPCKGCRGLCCGPVPVTERELKIIKKKIRSMPHKQRLALEKQPRFYGTCIFYDLEKDRCGIYSARPEICRVFGYHKNLSCFRKPELATKDNWTAKEKHVGILSKDFTWKDFK